ncbi:MAG: putative quinol monooxygenase [Ferruginibacter sp.]
MKKRILIFLLLACSIDVMAQDKTITRFARITVDSLQLKAYTGLLYEQMNAAIKNEPGVLSYTVYADKLQPHHITIVEVYASNEAYLLHREAPHFKKYKEATKGMVLKLELSEVSGLMSLKK